MAATETPSPKKSDAPRVHPDAKRSRLRTIMGTLDRELTALAGEGGAAAQHANVLRVAYNELIAALDLGAEPDLRDCPVCGAIGFRGASRCGECWNLLVPEATD